MCERPITAGSIGQCSDGRDRTGTLHPQRAQADSGLQIVGVLPTDSGMHAVWDRGHFNGVVDYDTWEAELLHDADIERHIADGHFVPINIHADDAYAIAVRFDSVTLPALSGDEIRRVVVASEPYVFNSKGRIDVSGIEYVAEVPDQTRTLSAVVPAGRYHSDRASDGLRRRPREVVA